MTKRAVGAFPSAAMTSSKWITVGAVLTLLCCSGRALEMMDKTPLASAALPLDAIVFPSVEEEAEPVRAAANDSGSDRLASDQVHRAVNEAVALYLLGASDIFSERLSSSVSPVARNRTVVALVAEQVTRNLAPSVGLDSVGSTATGGTFLQEACPTQEGGEFSCRPLKYRLADSYCNNVQNPRWGNAYTSYARLIPAHYDDGLSAVRRAVSGSELPSAFHVAEKIHTSDKASVKGYLTTLAPVWAQLLLNDISDPISFADLGANENCCGGDINNSTMCMGDGEPCRQYSRTASAPRRKCQLGAREQMNGATSFLDASTIYGSTEEAASELRTFDAGFLKTSYGDLLPTRRHGCPSTDNSCIYSGDNGVKDSAALTVLHTLLHRQHNRLAQKLGQINPLWDDETLYQEARRIVSAQVQHISYGEFASAILGESLADNLRLTPRVIGHFEDYDIDVYPATYHAAVDVALASWISMMPPLRQLSNASADESLRTQQVEQLLSGLINTRSLRLNLQVDKDVRGSGENDKLVEILLRGRDHGLPSYTAWRRYCALEAVNNFTDLANYVSGSNIVLLSSVYADVNDIDLFTGALAETPLKGAVVGPTIGCILAHQFSSLRKSDRFWYENDVPPSSFTKEQLQEIRKTTLSGLICENFDAIKSMPPKAFVGEDSFLNSPISCRLLPSMSVKPWVSDVPALQVPEDLLEQSIERALVDLAKRRAEEELLYHTNIITDPKSPASIHSGFNKPTKEAILLSNTSILLEYASEEFISHLEHPKFSRVKRQLGFLNNIFGRPTRPVAQGLNNVDVTRFVQPAAGGGCRDNEQTLPCDATTPFRKFSAFCNNLRNPSFGNRLTTFSRLLPADYDDSISRPRWRSKTGTPLPSPRLISVVLHQDVSNMHRRYTMLTTMFGQFLDHDITMTPVSRGVNEAVLNCRDCDAPTNVHPECWPIPIPSNDPFFPRVNTQTGRPICLPFTRSLPGQQNLGARQQVNQNTAFIDASHIYGQTVCDSNKLRAFSGGRLNSTLSPFGGQTLLPQSNLKPECQASSRLCFEAGDSRVTENPGLSVLHTSMLREHNRIATELQALNRNWDDERLFQTSRRIVNAIWQHVSFNEYLPRVLGWNAVNLYGLNLLTEGYFEGYDPNCNAGIFNEFSTAAYRFGHSLVRPFFPRVDTSFAEKQPLLMRQSFFNSEMLMEFQAIDEVMRGMFISPMEGLDQFITGEITNHLFETRSIPFSGFDLASLNIQRGRDHGLRPYNEYRAACNLKRAVNFEDLSREMTPAIIDRLKQVYTSVDDIDLWTGGLVETPLQGGLVGPTFGCIIGNQFRALRRCDRFWYENGNQAGRFSEAQLAEIRKVAFSRVICQNSDTITELPRSVFDLPHNFLNPRVPCRSLPQLDLNPWRDQQTTSSCVVLSKTIALGASSLVSPCTSCTCTTEGAQCQSLRVNCQQLLAEVGRDAVLADNVCRVQCAFLVNPQPQAPAPAPAPAPPPQQQLQQLQQRPRPALRPVAPVAPQRPRGARFNLLNIFG